MSGWIGGGLAAVTPVGHLVDLPYLPNPIPHGFMLWDGEVHAIAEARRLFAKIGHTFKLPGDAFDETTHFRFGGGAVVRKGAAYVVPSASVYPLADDGTMAAAAGFAHLPMTAPAYQSYTYTQTAAGAPVARLGLPANLAAAALPAPAAGAIGTQLKVTTFDVPAAGEYHDPGGLLVAVLNGGGATVGFAAVSIYQKQDGTIHGNLTVNGAPAGDVLVAAPVLGKSVGLYVNADGTIGWTAAGVDRGAVPGLVVAPGNKVIFGTVVNDGPAYTAGLTASANFLAATADLTEPFPVGTMGAGNALGGGVVGGYQFGRGGSNTTDAHALTKAELPVQAQAEGLMNPANYAKTVYTVESSTAPAAGHSHTFDPLHDAVVTLVRI